MGRLPEDCDWVLSHRGIMSDQTRVFCQGLCDDQSVERITMMLGQRAYGQDMGQGHGQDGNLISAFLIGEYFR